MMFSTQIDAFSPSQLSPSQNDAATPSKLQGATPLTVKQIADAYLAGAGETDKIRVLGTVSGKAERATDVSFTLDDGTGRLDFIRWVNDAADCAETAAIQNGMYVSVIGTLKGIEDKKHATAFCVRPVSDYNEVTLHFVQCMRMHIENTESKVPVASGTNGSGTDLYTQVLNVLNEPASIDSDHGVHVDEIAKRLRLPAEKIMEAIVFHVDAGHIYTTIDDFHLKSAESATGDDAW
ncbi:unnamed protein product [Alopecurus aequalis]